MSHHHDDLPRTNATSALVRLMVWKLNDALLSNGHHALTIREHAAMFDLASASEILDRIAILPRMADAEDRMRRDLLDLFAVFNPGDPLEQTIEQPGTAMLIDCGVQVLA